MTSNKGDQSILAWVLLIILSIIWGSSFILIKKGLVVFSPGEVGALRIVFAGLFLLPFSIYRLKEIPKKYWLLLFYVGLTGSFIPAFLFAKAQTQLDSSIAGVLNALTPLFTLLIGFVFFRKRIGTQNWLGMIIGFIGTTWLALSTPKGIGDLNLYVFFVIAATILYGINVNLIKFKIREIPPLLITGVSLLLLLPVGIGYLFLGTDFYYKVSQIDGSGKALSYIILLGVLGTAIALVIFNKLIKISSPIFSSSVTYFIPVIAISWGILDGEKLFWSHYLGIAAIILGVYFAGKKT
jgi:drug/metabolite transporter (DMT)-like permease